MAYDTNKRRSAMATNINNINYINNNKLQINECEAFTNDRGSDQVKGETKSQVLGAVKHRGLLPQGWQWIRADLFSPRPDQFKLSVSVCKNQAIKRMMASLNSPWWCFRRGLVDSEWANPHYELVRDTRQQLKNAGYRVKDIRASKFYRPGFRHGKGDTLKGMSVLLVPEPQEHRYSALLIHESQQIAIPLRGDANTLTPAQRSVNIIASYYGERLTRERTGIDIGDYL